MKAGWQKKKLGDVCEYFNGKAHEQYIDENGQFIVINSKFISSEGNDFKRTNEALFPLFPGDIVMVLSDVPNGKALAKCYLIEECNKFTLNQRICAIRSKNFHSKFLYYQLNRNKYLLSFDNGENQTNLRLNQILNCSLYVPPIPEQQRIVAILDEAFDCIATAIANAEKNLQNAREIFESYLESVFSQRGEGLSIKKLTDVCKIKPPKSEVRKLLDSSDLVSFAPMENLGIAQKYLNATQVRTLGEVVGSYTYFADGDVLLAKITPCFENGKLGIAQDLTNGIGFGSSEYIVFRTIKVLNNEFLYYFLSREQFREEGTKMMSGAVGHKRVSMEFIENCSIPIPPLLEQQRIVSQLDALSAETQRLETIYQQKLTALDELKKSLLHQAFNGEL